MKMLDLLLKHLPNNGGWPDGADYIADNGHGHVFKYCTKGQISGGSVPCLVRIDSTGLETVTREQYESALSAKNNEPDWDGEGLPPVGVECEVKGCIGDYQEWKKVTVFAVRDKTVFFEHDGRWAATANHEFRPIRSPEDVARDEAIKAMREALGHAAGLIEVSNIYRAIAAGKIPGIKLDGAA